MHLYPIKSLKNCGLFLPNQILEIDNNVISNCLRFKSFNKSQTI